VGGFWNSCSRYFAIQTQTLPRPPIILFRYIQMGPFDFLRLPDRLTSPFIKFSLIFLCLSLSNRALSLRNRMRSNKRNAFLHHHHLTQFPFPHTTPNTPSLYRLTHTSLDLLYPCVCLYTPCTILFHVAPVVVASQLSQLPPPSLCVS
jgi:hypothetical protein